MIQLVTETESVLDWLKDTEGRQVARIATTPQGDWMILPEPDYPLVIMVETGIVKMWDRKNNKPVEFETTNEGKNESSTD